MSGFLGYVENLLCAPVKTRYGSNYLLRRSLESFGNLGNPWNFATKSHIMGFIFGFFLDFLSSGGCHPVRSPGILKSDLTGRRFGVVYRGEMAG